MSAKETTKDTKCQSVKAKSNKQLANAQTSKRARPPPRSPKHKRGFFSFRTP